MEAQLSLEFLRVVENAAIAAARTMGFGDRHKADEVAVEAMRKTMDSVQMDGTIVIGEGERDRHPCCTSAKKLGWQRTRLKPFFRRSTLLSTPWKEPICARLERRTRLPCSPRATEAAYCTLLICIWRKLWSGHPARVQLIWMRPWPIT